jgi:hypothetical protein
MLRSKLFKESQKRWHTKREHAGPLVQLMRLDRNEKALF